MERSEDDIPPNPALDATSPAAVPFYLDPDWVEMPGSLWTPEKEYAAMPPREPTPGEVADTHCKRGGLEAETSPTDPILQNLDFTSEYITPEERKRMNSSYISRQKPAPKSWEEYLETEDGLDNDAW
jgi:hypothetical protein